ncbi:hypothetical protein C1V97_26125, partial [Burkholderia pseudomallei]|nr:hypothetical protein [Burkholderia pseudomallei]NAX70520.1 hypothetical protein [Burkholderia pseudomallei]
ELTGTATSNTSSSRSAPRSPGFRDEPKKSPLRSGLFRYRRSALNAA